jgi:hypothetical protein
VHKQLKFIISYLLNEIQFKLEVLLMNVDQLVSHIYKLTRIVPVRCWAHIMNKHITYNNYHEAKYIFTS